MVKTQTYRIQMAMPTQSKQKVKFQLLRWVNMLIICEPWKLSMSIHMHKLRHVYTYIYIYIDTPAIHCTFSVPSCFLPQPLPVICSTNVHTAPPPPPTISHRLSALHAACSSFTFESTELLDGVVLGRPVDVVPEFSLEDADDAWFKGFRVEI